MNKSACTAASQKCSNRHSSSQAYSIPHPKTVIKNITFCGKSNNLHLYTRKLNKNPLHVTSKHQKKILSENKTALDASSPKQSQKRISVDWVSEVTHSSWLSSTTIKAGSSRVEMHIHLLWWVWSRNFWRYSTVNTSGENHHYQQNLKQAETDVNMITQC